MPTSRSTTRGGGWKNAALIGGVLLAGLAAASTTGPASNVLSEEPALDADTGGSSWWSQLSASVPSFASSRLEGGAAEPNPDPPATPNQWDFSHLGDYAKVPSWLNRLSASVSPSPSPNVADDPPKPASWYDQLSSTVPSFTLPRLADHIPDVSGMSSKFAPRLPTFSVPQINVVPDVSGLRDRISSAMPTIKAPRMTDYLPDPSAWGDRLSSVLSPLKPINNNYVPDPSVFLNTLTSAFSRKAETDTADITLHGRGKWHGIGSYNVETPWWGYEAYTSVPKDEATFTLFEEPLSRLDERYRHKSSIRLCEIFPSKGNHFTHTAVNALDLPKSGDTTLQIDSGIESSGALGWFPSLFSRETPRPLVQCTASRVMPKREPIYWEKQFLDPNGEKYVGRTGASFFGPYTEEPKTRRWYADSD